MGLGKPSGRQTLIFLNFGGNIAEKYLFPHPYTAFPLLLISGGITPNLCS